MNPGERLSGRLEAVLALVPVSAHLVDVGCDHALVPLAAVQRGLALRATGVDRAAAPLAHARRNLDATGETRVQLLQAHGLCTWNDQTAEVVVLAGLGARAMVHVIETAPAWLRERATWVLQPNTEWPWLRHWARAQGWHLQSECLIHDERRYFLTCRYQAAPGPDLAYAGASGPLALMPAERALEILGPVLWSAPDATYVDWLTQEARRLHRVSSQGGRQLRALAALFEAAVAHVQARVHGMELSEEFDSNASDGPTPV